MQNIHSFFGSSECQLKLLLKYDGRDRVFQEHHIDINKENISFYYKNVDKFNLVFEKLDKEKGKLYLKIFNERENIDDDNKNFFDNNFFKFFSNIFVEYFDKITIKKWKEGYFTFDLLSNHGNLVLCNLGVLLDKEENNVKEIFKENVKESVNKQKDKDSDSELTNYEFVSKEIN